MTILNFLRRLFSSQESQAAAPRKAGDAHRLVTLR